MTGAAIAPAQALTLAPPCFDELVDAAERLWQAGQRRRPSALARARRVLPAALFREVETRGMARAEAEQVVAREAGFRNWTELQTRRDPAGFDDSARERAIVEAALAGAESVASRLLADAEDIENSLPCALALASDDALRLLSEANAAHPCGELGWLPLHYVCFSRFGNGDAAVGARRVAIAERLLALGADPNIGMVESETVRGFRTCLGGAVGRARSPELARRLLSAGAEIDDGPTLYEGSAMWEAVRCRDVESLQLLVEHEPPFWHICHALPQALHFADEAGNEMLRLLLAAGADTNWTMGSRGFDGNCLHEAIMLGRDVGTVQALLAAGAQVDFLDRDGRVPLQLAVALNQSDTAALLRENSADDGKVRPVDRLVSACLAGDHAGVRRIVEEGDDVAGSFKPTDHVWLGRALHTGNVAAARLMLEAGFDANVHDDDGQYPLHVAAARGDVAAVECLLGGDGPSATRTIAFGQRFLPQPKPSHHPVELRRDGQVRQAAGRHADPKATNYAAETALDQALRLDDEDVRDRLAELLMNDVTDEARPRNDDPAFAGKFEQAADAVVAGDADALAKLLADLPALVEGRSARAHRCTLLNYLGANGFEHERQKTPPNAVQIIELLLAAGSDPNASSYAYRGGPGANTMALLTSSSHPQRAGLTIPMVAALARGGAVVGAEYELLCALHEADREQRLGDALGQIDVAAAAAAQALVQAAATNERMLLLALLDAGVDVNAPGNQSIRPLHQAAFYGHEELVDVLLERGADLTLTDDLYNGTAAGWARAGEHEALSKRLSELAAR